MANKLLFFPSALATQRALRYGSTFTPSHTHSHADDGGQPFEAPTRPHREQCVVKYLPEGHVGMWTGGAGNQTADLLISVRAVLPL